MPIVQVTRTKSNYDGPGVPPDGDPESRIAFIGEAPAAAEIIPRQGYPHGRPFSGPAGGVFDECLHNAGLARQECYVTNVFKKPITKNGANYKLDGKLVYVEKKGFTEEGKKWVALLCDELDKVKANVFVPMGESAIHALTGHFSPLSVRGSIYESTTLPGRKCVASLHPAYALRDFVSRYLIIYDFRRVKKQSMFPEIHRPKRCYITRPTFDEVMAVMNRYISEKQQPRAVDLETYNNEVSCAGFGTKDECLIIPFTVGTEHYWDSWQEAQVWLKIAEFMEDPDIIKIFQNGLFDMSVFTRCNILPRGRLEDIMVGFKQMYPDFRAYLPTISSIYTEEPYYKEEFKAWTASAYKKHTIDILWNYNGKDVAVTHESWLGIIPELKQRQMHEFPYRFTMDTYYPALYIETRGIAADIEDLKKTRNQLEAREIQLQAELNELAGRPLNAKSSQQLKKYFYEERGITPYKNRKTGKPTVDDNALKRLSKGTATRRPLQEASIIREIRSISKLRGTYLDIALDGDNRMRCAIHPVGTKNGRWSTSKTLFGTGTNMQNLPPEMKKFLKADPGCLLIEIDKAQGEWVIVAFMSGDANMMEVARTGADAHTATAHLAFGVPEDLIIKENKIAGHETNPLELAKLRRKFVPEILEYLIPSVMTCRQAGKKSNHGLNYDMGYKTFAFVNETPESDSRLIVEKYHQGYPGIRPNYHGAIRRQLQLDRTLTNVFGRKRMFYDRWDDALLKDGYAFPPQSGLVDLVNKGILSQWNDVDTWWKWRIDLLMQVHDSVLFQWLLKMFEYRMCAKAIINYGHHLNPTLKWEGREFTIRNDVKVGFNWGQYHPEHNPVGMRELHWTWDEEEMAFQLGEVHAELLNDYRNL